MTKRILILAVIFVFLLTLFSVPVMAKEKKVKVTVLPFSIYSAEDLSQYERDIQEVLLSALAFHEKIDPLDVEKLMEIVGDKAPEEMDEEYARKIGKKMGADYVIIGSMTKVGDTISLDAELVPVRVKKEPDRFYIETYGLSSVLDRVGDLAKKVNEKIFYDEIIVKVTILGNKRIPDQDILGVISSKEGTLPYTRFLSDDLKAITKMGYFEEVSYETKEIEEGTEVIFTVKERALVREVSITGNKKIKLEDIFEVITITPPEVLSIRELKESLLAIEDLYADKQYHAAKIEYQIETIETDEIRVNFSIDEGKKLMIKKNTFIGNDNISDRLLEKGLGNKSKGWIWWFTDRGTFKKDELDNDVDRVTAVYYDHGYIEAVVEPSEVDMREDGIYITYNISEGRQYRVGEVDVSGDLIKSKEELTMDLQLKPKKVFSREYLMADIENLVRIYNNEGYALVDVQPQTMMSPDDLIVNVTYNIIKGKKTYFERINISGNIKTMDKVIRRELKFAEGGLFNGDDFERSKERIENLGYFEEVNFATERGSADDKVVVNVEVKERPTGLITAGLGYSSVAELTGMIRLQERNLFGRGYRVAVMLEFSSIEVNFSGSIEDPYFLDTNLALSLRIYNVSRSYDTYDTDTFGFEIGAGYPVFDDTRLFMTYIFNDVNIRNIDDNAPADVWEYEGHTITSGIEAMMVRDTRDNIYDPSRGSVNSLSIFFAGLGGDMKYYKMVGESSWYFPVWWKLVFHPKVLMGYSENFGDGDLPIYARFFAGGINSIRGFKPYSVGPVDPVTGEYLGGNKELIVNLELIFPLFEDIGMKGVVFFDMGNVWGESESWDFSDMRYAIGAGVRWFSPMGPIRVEWGYNLDPKPDESSAEWSFSVGTSF